MLLAKGRGAYRLIDGTGEPLNPRNKPWGKVEKDALAAALNGEITQVVQGNKLLSVFPLPYAAEACSICHTNYIPLAPGEEGDIVGAISIRVPIPKD